MTTAIDNERTYASKQGLKAGLASAGLEALNYEVREVGEKFAATVFVHNKEDQFEVQRRGFTAEVDTDKAAT